MALSPNYSWAEPDNSSLVKNGASDIRTLGDAIDTSVWNVGFGQAGKNKIINGDFRVNQRAFSSTTTNGDYGFDRWTNGLTTGGGTVTFSAQTFTLGAAPVAGYEGTNFYRCVTSAQANTDSRAQFRQNIESVRTFAGQTITVSFWAKAATGTPSLNVEMLQVFGSGGSPSASVSTVATKQAITTAWARYSWTVAIPSISGKTLGTAGDMLRLNIWASAGSDNNASSGTLGIQNNTFDIWGVQVEYGSKATPFQTATGGSPQAELAMCQRYYYRLTAGASGRRFGTGYGAGVTAALILTEFPVSMRTNPTALEQSGTAGDYSFAQGTTVLTSSAVPSFNTATIDNGGTLFTFTAGTIDAAAGNGRATNATGFLGWSAEL